jgi:outer membrane receptor protein involved in Fe transport
MVCAMWPLKPRSGVAPAPASRHEGRSSRHRGAPLVTAVTAAIALAATLYSGTALADARTEARRHFKAGMALIAQKKLPEGIAELEKAYEIYPHPSVAFNVAVAQADLGRYDLAIGAYRTYLDSNPPDRADVEKLIADLTAKLAAQRAEKAAAEVKPEVKPGEKPPEVKPGEKPPEVKPGEKPPEIKPEVKPGEKPPEVLAQPEKPAGETSIGQTRTEDVYEEKVITASRGAQSPLDAPNSTTIITRQDIRLSGQTRIPELLRRVAGMDVMQITGGDTNVSMRGFNSRLANKLLVLVNGRSVYNDILGSTFWESFTIDVDQIERIEVVRGPGSALYGANAFAGVVNIILIAPGEGKTGVHVGIGDGETTYGSGWATGRAGDFAYRASVGYTRYPRWTREISNSRIDLNVSDFDQNLGAENLRTDLRFSYRIDKNDELTFGGGFARVALDVYGIGPFNDYQLQADNSDVSVEYKGKYINARAYYDRLNSTASQDYVYLGHSLDTSHPDQNVFTVEAEYVNQFRWPQVLLHDVHIGLGYKLKDITWEYLEQPTPIEHHMSAYVQDTVKIADKVNLVASGRVDYEPYLKRLIGSPRGSVVFKPTDRQALRISGSSAFRAPSYLESYLSLPVQVTLPGVSVLSATKREDIANFVLQPEQITSAEIGYLNQQSDSFDFEINAYYNRVSNLIELSPVRPETLSDRAAGLGGFNPTVGEYNVAFGGWDNSPEVYNVFGGEIGGHVYPVDGLDLFANYAINYTKTQYSNTNLPDDQRTSHHKINLGVQLRTKIGFNGEITFYYQSSEVWNEQISTLTGIVYQQFPLPGYTLLNGRLGWRFFHDRIELSATVFNALAGVGAPPPQMHPFGNQIGRRVMGFFSYTL